MIDQPTQYGFIGGGHVVVTPDKDFPYSSITGFGSTGTLFRDDGQTFPWKGVNPFDYKLNDAGEFASGGPPAYINVCAIPGAPKNVLGARDDVWLSSPRMSVYAGRHNFGGWGGIQAFWLYPITAGEVLWLTVGSGGYADDRKDTYKPRVDVSISSSNVENPLRIEWIMATKDGTSAVAYSRNGNYYKINVNSVTRSDNVGDPYRENQTRYDVSMTMDRIWIGGPSLDAYVGVSGKTFPSPPIFIRDNKWFGSVDVQHSISYSDKKTLVVDTVQAYTSSDSSDLSASAVDVQVTYRLTNEKYTIKLDADVLIEYEIKTWGFEDGYTTSSPILYGTVGNYFPSSSKIQQYMNDYKDSSVNAIAVYQLCGSAGSAWSSDPGSNVFFSVQLKHYPNSIIGFEVYQCSASGRTLVSAQFINASKMQLFDDNHKIGSGLYLRATSPDKIALSSNPDDESTFFV